MVVRQMGEGIYHYIGTLSRKEAIGWGGGLAFLVQQLFSPPINEYAQLHETVAEISDSVIEQNESEKATPHIFTQNESSSKNETGLTEETEQPPIKTVLTTAQIAQQELDAYNELDRQVNAEVAKQTEGKMYTLAEDRIIDQRKIRRKLFVKAQADRGVYMSISSPNQKGGPSLYELLQNCVRDPTTAPTQLRAALQERLQQIDDTTKLSTPYQAEQKEQSEYSNPCASEDPETRLNKERARLHAIIRKHMGSHQKSATELKTEPQTEEDNTSTSDTTTYHKRETEESRKQQHQRQIFRQAKTNPSSKPLLRPTKHRKGPTLAQRYESLETLYQKRPRKISKEFYLQSIERLQDEALMRQGARQEDAPAIRAFLTKAPFFVDWYETLKREKRKSYTVHPQTYHEIEELLKNNYHVDAFMQRKNTTEQRVYAESIAILEEMKKMLKPSSHTTSLTKPTITAFPETQEQITPHIEGRSISSDYTKLCDAADLLMRAGIYYNARSPYPKMDTSGWTENGRSRKFIRDYLRPGMIALGTEMQGIMQRFQPGSYKKFSQKPNYRASTREQQALSLAIWAIKDYLYNYETQLRTDHYKGVEDYAITIGQHEAVTKFFDFVAQSRDIKPDQQRILGNNKHMRTIDDCIGTLHNVNKKTHEIYNHYTGPLEWMKTRFWRFPVYNFKKMFEYSWKVITHIFKGDPVKSLRYAFRALGSYGGVYTALNMYEGDLGAAAALVIFDIRGTDPVEAWHGLTWSAKQLVNSETSAADRLRALTTLYLNIEYERYAYTWARYGLDKAGILDR